MWANHNANCTWDKRLSGDSEIGRTVIWNGAVNREILNTIEDRVIERYFTKENYYKINDCPVFMFYDIGNLIKGLGGAANTADAIQEFRRKVKAAGFPDLHLQMALWGEDLLNVSGFDDSSITPAGIIRSIGVDSLTHYQFCHFADVSKDYISVLEDVKKEWSRINHTYSMPFFSHVSIGWDNNPRFLSEVGPVMKDCTPENFKKGLYLAKEYADQHPEQPPLITINSWNEWTENSYLEPDDVCEYGFLDAVKEVFGE